MTTTFEVGQRWAYRTRQQDVGSTVLIGRIDSGPMPVIHVRIDGVNSPARVSPVVIGHMPISVDAFAASVTELRETGVPMAADFAEGVAMWTQDEGGVFEVTVSEAVDVAMSAFVPAIDPFDELVTEMRATRSVALVEQLYRRVVSLDFWFFLREPSNPGAPVQWRFPEGINPTPAVLVFTSFERAEAAAVLLGLAAAKSPDVVMAASTQEAILWITGPDFANEWLCVNLTQEEFPLYVSYLADLPSPQL